MSPEGGPPLGLGCAGIGNHRVALDDAVADAILDNAWTHGIRLFDTAPHYGLGLSERRLGEFLAGRPRTEFRVSTKAGRRLVPQANPSGALDDEGFVVPADTRGVWDFTEAGIRAGVEESLTRLRLDRLDTVYLHDPERDDLTAALEQGLPALIRLRGEGLIGSIGVGSMDRSALLAAARRDGVDELMVANRYTLADQRAADELLPLCLERGIAVVAAAVFNGGLLAGTPTRASSFDYGPVPDDVLARVEPMAAACRAAGVPLAAAALQFPLRHPAVRTVVAGATKQAQVGSTVALLRTAIPDGLWPLLDERAGAVTP